MSNGINHWLGCWVMLIVSVSWLQPHKILLKMRDVSMKFISLGVTIQPCGKYTSRPADRRPNPEAFD